MFSLRMSPSGNVHATNMIEFELLYKTRDIPQRKNMKREQRLDDSKEKFSFPMKINFENLIWHETIITMRLNI